MWAQAEALLRYSISIFGNQRVEDTHDEMHTMKVIAFKALFTIGFPVEKQYPGSVIDFSPFLPSAQIPSQQTNQLQL